MKAERLPGEPHLDRILAAGLLLSVALSASAPRPSFQLWRRDPGGYERIPGAREAPLAAGSLQKPFVAQAWAAAHPGQAPPRLRCAPGPGCWNREGHGELGLVRALAVSCNAYFRALATNTPAAPLQAAFSEAGFQGVPHSADAAIGLHDGTAPPVIRPRDLLAAYLRLVQVPWPAGEEVRQQVLAGLREAARDGTAEGLGRAGGWAKTGTVPLDPLHTCGLALVVDPAGWALLGRLEPGTGRAAARRLAAAAEGRPPAPHSTAEPARPTVTVRMFELFRGRRILVGNPGPTPLPTSEGFLGPGARAELADGHWVGPGLLELTEPRSGLVRQVRGLLRCQRGAAGVRTLVLGTPPRDYVAGVIAAELAPPAHPLRIELGAAVLRFLARGRRHPEADVCDSTHCAWFVGAGAAPRWPAPTTPDPPRGAAAALSDLEWAEMQTRARQPGPAQWTSHCGGRSLNPHALWGGGDAGAAQCTRHNVGQARPWQRVWTRSDAEKAFGMAVIRIDVAWDGGTWTLRVTGPGGTRAIDYDTAHRRIAALLGWGALPSPAEEVVAGPEGFILRGVGLGHRVGLCLGD